jgi:hypothetical protein
MAQSLGPPLVKYFFPTTNLQLTTKPKSANHLYKFFFFFIPYFIYIYNPLKPWTLCHGLILYCTCAPDQNTNLKHLWVQFNSVSACVAPALVAAPQPHQTQTPLVLRGSCHRLHMALHMALTQGWTARPCFNFHFISQLLSLLCVCTWGSSFSWESHFYYMNESLVLPD